MSKVRVRFPPSPTGSLHLGGARTALFNWLFARANKGTFILRIEDTDRTRYKEEALQGIFDGLRWLGLDWDEGPEISPNSKDYFQSNRTEIYQKYMKVLLEKGSAYKCFCTPERLQKLRESQQKNGETTGYDRKCRNLSLEEVNDLEKKSLFVVRLKIPDEGVTEFRDEIRGIVRYENKVLDDLVLMKTDGFPTYHLANVVDDHLMNITHVMRGDEWIASTPRHVILYKALSWEMPKFVHLPVILAPGGGKMSKRHGATSVMEYKEKGYLSEALVNFLSLLGWAPGNDCEIMTIEEMTDKFSLEKINPKSSVFDEKKLEWMNGQYLMKKSNTELFDSICELWIKSNYITEADRQDKREWLLKIIDQLKLRSKRLVDFVERGKYFFIHPDCYEEKAKKKFWRNEDVVDKLQDINGIMGSISNFIASSIEERVRKYTEEKEIGIGKIIHPVRLAVSGLSFGPGLFELLELLGKNVVSERIEKAVQYIKNNQ